MGKWWEREAAFLGRLVALLRGFGSKRLLNVCVTDTLDVVWKQRLH